MTQKRIPDLSTLISTEDVEGLLFLARGTARAPLRRLLPFTLFVAIFVGFVVGIAVGVPTGHLAYYLAKEISMGIIGGIFAPAFLIFFRRAYLQWRGRSDESRPAAHLLYALSGACAGGLMILLQSVYPPLIPFGLWVVFYPIGVAALFPVIGAMADYVQSYKQEIRETKELFGKYVSESVARRILEQRDQINLTGEKRRCTVLFSDIRGFTRMVKEWGAEEMVRTLNEYFARMIDVIFQYDGTVNKFIGDGIVVLFGAPVTLESEAYRAIETAAAMHCALKEMNAARAAKNKPPIRIGIGIDTGEVVVGNIGSVRRLEYTAIGAPVNNAYFLGSMAPPDTVYITENAYREITQSVPVKPWQKVQLKGGTGEVMVYTLEDYSFLLASCASEEK